MSYYDSGTGHRSIFVAGMLAGGLVATGAMLFLAPMSGDKMRKRMLSKGMELQDVALGTAGDLTDTGKKLWKKQNKKLLKQARQMQGKAYDRMEDVRGRAFDRLDDVRQVAYGRLDDLRGRADDKYGKMRHDSKKMFKKQKKGLSGFMDRFN
jgi:gas vesicle protein